MVSENDEMPNGWPFGLGFLNMRVRVTESLPPVSAEPYSLHIPSTTFSSFSSSNLDTESTASFFQDNSVSLGHLIGIKNSLRFEEREKIAQGSCSDDDASKVQLVHMFRGICLPMLLGIMLKIRKSKKKSRN